MSSRCDPCVPQPSIARLQTTSDTRPLCPQTLCGGNRQRIAKTACSKCSNLRAGWLWRVAIVTKRASGYQVRAIAAFAGGPTTLFGPRVDQIGPRNDPVSPRNDCVGPPIDRVRPRNGCVSLRNDRDSPQNSWVGPPIHRVDPPIRRVAPPIRRVAPRVCMLHGPQTHAGAGGF